MMNLLARILSHGFAITVVLLLAIGFMYRGELFPDWELPEFLVLDSSQEAAGSDTAGTISREDATTAVAETTDTMAEAVADPDAGSDAESVLAEDADVSEPGTPPETTPETAPVMAAEATDSNQAEMPDAVVVETDVTMETEQVETAEDEDKSITDAPANQELVIETVIDVETEEPVLAEQTPAEPVQDVMQQDQEATEEPEEVAVQEMQESPEAVQDSTQDSTEISGAGPYELLAAAREAYWLRDYELAEGQYRKLIELQPDNPDGYGELGNMYFSQGNWEAAASAYYEAGTRLLGEGLLVQAQQMVDVIRGLKGSQADDLAQQVEAARTESH